MKDVMTTVYDILMQALAWFFPDKILAYPTTQFIIDVLLFLGGLYMLYFILIKPIVIFFRSLKSWGIYR